MDHTRDGSIIHGRLRKVASEGPLMYGRPPTRTAQGRLEGFVFSKIPKPAPSCFCRTLNLGGFLTWHVEGHRTEEKPGQVPGHAICYN